MAYQKNTWVARQGTGLNKFTNSGTSTNLILSPNPDTITQSGTPFSADWMNNIENGIANNDERITLLERDTGWVDLTPLNGTWNYFQYRVINGNHVYIRGYATALAASSNVAVKVAQMPSGTVPSVDYYFYGLLQGANICRFGILNTGEIDLEWALKLSDGSRYTATSWYRLFCDYFID